MRKTNNTIKINGNTYDAITGEVLGGDTSTDTSESTATAGAIIKPSPVVTSHKATAPAHNPKRVTNARQKARPAARTPQPSKTLMRHSVRKPSHAANSHDKTHLSRTSKLAAASTTISIKKSAHHVDEKRLQHAKSISKSHKIKKFSKTEPVAHQPAHPKPHQVQHHITTTHPRRATHHKPAHRPKTSADLLQEALHHATSHKQPAPKQHLSRSHRIAGLSVLVVATGLLLGLVVIQSTPAIKMRVASAKAGFAASLPGDSPAGFHMSDLSYGAGAVAMNYDSNSDSDRTFSITQKSSSWDSTTLRDTFVEKNDKNFSVIEDGGLTVFLYGDNNATWVSNGVWYQVQGNGSLSDRQLVDIAKSL